MAYYSTDQGADIAAWQEILDAQTLDHNTARQIQMSHPLASRLCRYGISMAISTGFKYHFPNAPQEAIDRFVKAQNDFSVDNKIVQLHMLKKVYGVASLVVGQIGKDTITPLDYRALSEGSDNKLFFNVLEPLITAGSLVGSLDPNSSKFLNPTIVTANGRRYHSSRCFVAQNEEEQAEWLEYQSTGYGFLARSVFYRSFPLLKQYLRLKIAEVKLATKLAVLVIKTENTGNVLDRFMEKINIIKKAKVTNANVFEDLIIGREDDVKSMDLKDAQGMLEELRKNCLIDIATSAGNMPASLLRNESLAAGSGDGTHDKEKEDLYFIETQKSMKESYAFVDDIVMRAVWTRGFVEWLKATQPRYAKYSYEFLIQYWSQGYVREFLPPFAESPLELMQQAEKKQGLMNSLVGALGQLAMLPIGPQNKSAVADWLANNLNDMQILPNDLELDIDEIIQEMTQQLGMETENEF